MGRRRRRRHRKHDNNDHNLLKSGHKKETLVYMMGGDGILRDQHGNPLRDKYGNSTVPKADKSDPGVIGFTATGTTSKNSSESNKTTYVSKYENHPKHYGQHPVPVGPYHVYLGGTRDLIPKDFEEFDVLVPLVEYGMPKLVFGKLYAILAAPLQDHGGVPKNWKEFLFEKVIPLLAAEQKLLAFCMGSHGRTGCFLASLISLLEPEEEDPIAAARERHCTFAVESLEQAEAVFALRGKKLPKIYQDEFSRSSKIWTTGNSVKHGHSSSKEWYDYDNYGLWGNSYTGKSSSGVASSSNQTKGGEEKENKSLQTFNLPKADDLDWSEWEWNTEETILGI